MSCYHDLSNFTKDVFRLTRKKVLLLAVLILITLFLSLSIPLNLTSNLRTDGSPGRQQDRQEEQEKEEKNVRSTEPEERPAPSGGGVSQISPLAEVEKEDIAGTPPVPGTCREESKDCGVVYSNNCSLDNKRDSVRLAFVHAWTNYRRFAWGSDNLKPVSRTGENPMFGMGVSIVESLGTLRLMGLEKFEAEAEKWLEEEYSLSDHTDASVFEAATRLLAGFLEMHYLTDKRIYLDKAVELGTLIRSCYKAGNLVPNTRLNLKSRTCKAPSWCLAQKSDCLLGTAEVATTSLEIRALALSTGDLAYFSKANDTANLLLAAAPPDGLVPPFVNKKLGTHEGFAWHTGAGVPLGELVSTTIFSSRDQVAFHPYDTGLA